MDLRSLLLSSTHTVVMDPDAVASAATRPTRDVDLERFEDELAQLGFVMSLDLAMTIRRLPHQAIEQLRGWISDTLRAVPGAKPTVPLFAGLPEASRYLRRVATWLVAQPEQPCPWCARVKALVPLDPCGHLVCHECWSAGTFVGCSVCHRRVSPADVARWDRAKAEPITSPPAQGQLALLYLGFDLVGAARARFEALAGGPRMSAAERAELASLIDTVGPKCGRWLPKAIPVAENLATVLARLWMIAPDRNAMMEETAPRLRCATDVLRIAVVLMGGDADLARIRCGSMPRSLRRAVLGAIDRLPRDELARGARERATLWKRVGAALHPFELVDRYPNAAFAFAIARGTDVSGEAFAGVRERAGGIVRISDNALCVEATNAPLEAALARRDSRGAIALLAKRPDALLRRYDAIARIAAEPALLDAASLVAIRGASPNVLLAFASHLEEASPLRESVAAELVTRAGKTRMFPRAVIDRALAQRLVVRTKAVTAWHVAAIHAAARGNVIYVREPTAWSTYRRRDGETGAQRFARLASPEAADARIVAVPIADAPTWYALVHDDVALPAGSAGFIVERDGSAMILELIAELRA